MDPGICLYLQSVSTACLAITLVPEMAKLCDHGRKTIY